MPFVTETLEQLIDEAEALYAAFDEEEMPLVEQKIKARQLAYVCNKLNDYVTFMGKQIIPTTAEEEYLEAHCALKDVPRKQVVASYGSVWVKGISGIILAAGTVLIRKSDNMRYTTIEKVILTGERQEINVVCATPGSGGNAAEGELMDFAIVLPGVESTAVVKLIGAGADREKDRDLLARYIIAVRNVYFGGADTDYIKWALSVEGVNQAWAEGNAMGLGTVTVWIMTPTGIPDAVLCQKVRDFIETKRPVTAKRIFVVGLNEKKISLTISDFAPDNDDLRGLVEASLFKYFKSLKKGESVKLKDIYEAISAVSGIENYHIDLTGDIEVGTNEIAVLEAVLWV